MRSANRRRCAVHRGAQADVALHDVKLAGELRMGDPQLVAHALDRALQAQAAVQADVHQVEKVGQGLPQHAMPAAHSVLQPEQRRRHSRHAQCRAAHHRDPGTQCADGRGDQGRQRRNDRQSRARGKEHDQRIRVVDTCLDELGLAPLAVFAGIGLSAAAGFGQRSLVTARHGLRRQPVCL